MAHVLFAKAMLASHDDPSAPKVDGEAFNITDGERHYFLGLSSKDMESRWLGTSAECMYAGTSYGARRDSSNCLRMALHDIHLRK